MPGISSLSTRLTGFARGYFREYFRGEGRFAYLRVTSPVGICVGLFAVALSYLLARYYVGPKVNSREAVAWTFGIVNATLVILLFGRNWALVRLLKVRDNDKERNND